MRVALPICPLASKASQRTSGVALRAARTAPAEARTRRALTPVAAVLVAASVLAGVPSTSAARPAGAAAGPIVFESHRTGAGEILETSPARNLTMNAAEDADPAWEPPRAECAEPAPGSQRVAFASNRTGDWDIYLLDPSVPDSPPPAENLTRTPVASDTAPAWSPSAYNRFRPAAPVRIAFTSDRDGNREIYVMDPTGGQQMNVTRNPADDANPEWSPDGQYIAFESTRSGSRQIWIVNVQDALNGGGQPTMVTHGDEPKSDPTWMTDAPVLIDVVAHELVYSTRYEGKQYLDVAIDEAPRAQSDRPPFAPSHTVVLPLTGSPGGADQPMWDAYGSTLLYRNTSPGSEGLWSLSVDSADLLTQTGQLAGSVAGDAHPDVRSAPAMCAGISPIPPRPAPVERPGGHEPPTAQSTPPALPTSDANSSSAGKRPATPISRTRHARHHKRHAHHRKRHAHHHKRHAHHHKRHAHHGGRHTRGHGHKRVET
jgi:WD40-like Beta Propeller Repeat